MSAEGLGLVIGFLGLFMTLVGLAVAGGVAYGKIFTLTMNTADKLDKMDSDNEQGHKEIFECQKSTDIKVGKMEQHLLSMNGSMKRHNDDIESLKKDSHRDS
ncbi:MAG TPA: hypothetical protein VIH69_05610 [Dehalococcoidia bacterium]